MILEQIARFFAYDRPGYALVDFAEVAFPVYKLSVVASFLETKPIPVMHEYVLRAINAGLNQDREIAGLLGIDTRLIESVLAELDSAELISVSHDNEGRRRLGLTQVGRKCADTASSIMPYTGEIVFYFDGFTRNLMSPPSEPLWRFRQVAAAGIKELSSRPPKKPAANELALTEAKRLSDLLSSVRGRAKRDLLAIQAIENSQRMFQVGQLLLYRAIEGNDTDFSIIIEGSRSEEHRTALIKAGGLAKFGIPTPDKITAEPLSVYNELSDEQLEELEKSTIEAIRLKQDAFETATAVTTGDRDGEPLETQLKINDEPEDLLHLRLRHLEVFEHPPLLDEALESATRRLMIISPWIRGAVLEPRRLQKLFALLEGGCQVFIGWGIGNKDRAKDNDMTIVKHLEGLHRQFANMYFVDLGNTHEKILIKDTDYVITTSFNWLSFKGDPARTLRHERGVYIGIPEIVDREFAKLVERFRGAKATKPSAAQLAALAAKFKT